MRRYGISYVPVVLAIVGILAGMALVSDHNVRTWAIVLSSTAVAAVGYGAYQEYRATKAVRMARRRASAPYDELRREVDRARRHERPFALARLELRPEVRSLPGSMLDELKYGTLQPAWRSTDRVWRDGRVLYLLMPETTASTARAVLERMLQTHADVFAAETTIASFPQDGVTIGALFAQLAGRPPLPDVLQSPDERRTRELVMDRVPVRAQPEPPPNQNPEP